MHSLRALAAAGIARAVVLVAADGARIIDHVAAHPLRLRALRIEWIDLREDWAGCHAQTILRARARLSELCASFLLVTSDHLFDTALLVRARAAFDEADGACAGVVLVEARGARATLESE